MISEPTRPLPSIHEVLNKPTQIKMTDESGAIVEQQVEHDGGEIQLKAGEDFTPPERHVSGGAAAFVSPEKCNKPVKIDYFDAEKQSWQTWYRVFEKTAHMNEWDEEKAARLFTHLRGAPLEVACGLPDNDIENYNLLVNTLEDQFGPSKQKILHVMRLRNMKMGKRQTFRELGIEIWKLSNLAYDVSYEERQRLAMVDFLCALPDGEVRKHVFLGRPSNLNEAVRLAEVIAGYEKWCSDDGSGEPDDAPTERSKTVHAKAMKKFEQTIARLMQSLEMRIQDSRSDVADLQYLTRGNTKMRINGVMSKSHNETKCQVLKTCEPKLSKGYFKYHKRPVAEYKLPQSLLVSCPDVPVIKKNENDEEFEFPFLCHKCRKPGHKRTMCPFKKQATNQGSNEATRVKASTVSQESGSTHE